MVDPPVKVPAYIQVDSFSFSTADSTGFNTQRITDVWLYVNNQIKGIYAVPTGIIPVLAEGESEIFLQPGVFADGIKANRVYYPFYSGWNTRQVLKKGKVVKLNPSFTYASGLKKPFLWYQDFEQSDSGTSRGRYGNVSLQRRSHIGQSQQAFGLRYGVLETATGDDIIELSNNIFIPLRQNGMPVYLEFDYKSTCAIQVGVEGYVGNSPPEGVYDLILRPTENWTKIYASLSDETQRYFSNARFRFFFRTLPQPGPGHSFSVDNIRLISY